MANTTFSGPIRAGNIRNTVGTTVGTDVANVGYVVMTQQHVADLSGGALTASSTNIVIPANSKIANILASGTSVGLKTITTQGGGTLEWKDTGSSDLRLTVTSSAGTNAGSAVITVMYAQAFNTAIQP